ncbi:hypothetical protein OUZ56_029941 [Daphnia magna]|uniref:Uncharacterized protein n=1 Tax=Daphnia magna TaxID=35525 RepID=A0ABR0B8A6_9CRUS|nr:hypothetical protein OUZ56_029941 [Daphnia magna]
MVRLQGQQHLLSYISSEATPLVGRQLAWSSILCSMDDSSSRSVVKQASSCAAIRLSISVRQCMVLHRRARRFLASSAFVRLPPIRFKDASNEACSDEFVDFPLVMLPCCWASVATAQFAPFRRGTKSFPFLVDDNECCLLACKIHSSV